MPADYRRLNYPSSNQERPGIILRTKNMLLHGIPVGRTALRRLRSKQISAAGCARSHGWFAGRGFAIVNRKSPPETRMWLRETTPSPTGFHRNGRTKPATSTGSQTSRGASACRSRYEATNPVIPKLAAVRWPMRPQRPARRSTDCERSYKAPRPNRTAALRAGAKALS